MKLIFMTSSWKLKVGYSQNYLNLFLVKAADGLPLRLQKIPCYL